MRGARKAPRDAQQAQHSGHGRNYYQHACDTSFAQTSFLVLSRPCLRRSLIRLAAPPGAESRSAQQAPIVLHRLWPERGSTTTLAGFRGK